MKIEFSAGSTFRTENIYVQLRRRDSQIITVCILNWDRNHSSNSNIHFKKNSSITERSSQHNYIRISTNTTFQRDALHIRDCHDVPLPFGQSVVDGRPGFRERDDGHEGRKYRVIYFYIGHYIIEAKCYSRHGYSIIDINISTV